MAALSWVHCNVCCAVPSQNSDRTFSLSSCGHLSCSNCIDKKGQENCSMCGKRCSKVLLKQPLPPQVVPWVTDPMPSLKQLKEVFRFQATQHNCLMELQMRKHAEVYQELLKRKQALENRREQLLREISAKRSSAYQCTPRGVAPQRTISTTTPLQSRQILLQTPATLGINHH